MAIGLSYSLIWAGHDDFAWSLCFLTSSHSFSSDSGTISGIHIQMCCCIMKFIICHLIIYVRGVYFSFCTMHTNFIYVFA